jgi:hypothetical protein
VRSLTKKSLRNAWQKVWLKEDFSWDGLVAKSAPARTAYPNFQSYIRSFSDDAVDSALIEMGILVKCGGGKLFHILFIPTFWRSIYVVNDGNFSYLRNKFLEFIPDSIPDFRSYALSGIIFYSDDAKNILGKIKNYHFCFFENGIILPESEYFLSLKNCYLGGSLDKVENLTNVFTIDLAGVYVCGSVRPRAAEDNLIDIKIKQSRISECLKVSDVRVRGIHVSNTTMGSLSIESCHIERQVEISEVEIRNGASFDSTDFGGHFSINRSKIDKFLRFFDCDFDDRVVFRDIEWPIGMVSSAYTTGSRFRELVTFSSRMTPPIQLFDGGTFEANIGFASTYHGRWNDAFLSELKSQDFDQLKASILASRIETGCRNLRNLAQERGDGPMEHFWHRAEIIARRRTSAVGSLERIASDAYGFFADYGLSIGKPFLWLLILWAAMSCLYAYSSGELWIGQIEWGSVVQGMAFSLHQTFPLSVFNDPDSKWFETVLGKSHSIENIGVRLIATLQTVLSAILIYLGVMAIRRKFKIG